MTKSTPTPRTPFARRTPVWAVLLVWMLAIGAPCAHCLAMGFAEPAAAAPALSAAEEAMLAGMPADCPMHQALAAAKAKEAAAAEGEKAPCDQPADCCLERGGMPLAEEDAVPAPSAPSAATFAPVAMLAYLAPPASPAAAGEPRFERAHAPPAFSIPLRT